MKKLKVTIKRSGYDPNAVPRMDDPTLEAKSSRAERLPREFTRTNARSTINVNALSSASPTIGHVSTTKKS
jgi:hypothetical protein